MTTLPKIEDWLKKMTQATTADIVYKLLKDFRKMEWTDEERSQMSKVYMRQLQKTGGTVSTANNAEDEDDGTDGPVWYEKM